MSLKFYKAVKKYIDVSEIVFCLAKDKKDVLDLLEWDCEHDEQGITIKRVPFKRSVITLLMVSNKEIESNKKLVKKADAALKDIFPNRGWLNEEQAAKFKEAYNKEPVLIEEEE